jgi:hypothetical protein
MADHSTISGVGLTIPKKSPFVKIQSVTAENHNFRISLSNTLRDVFDKCSDFWPQPVFDRGFNANRSVGKGHETECYK